MKIGPYDLNNVHQGDALERLKDLPDESIHCCITSPPYWGLREKKRLDVIGESDHNTDMRRKKNGQFMKGEHWRKHQPFRERDVLIEYYINREMSSQEIANVFGVSANAILFWLTKHGIKTRDTSQARKVKAWGLHGSDNPMWNRKGELNPNWRGGVSQERVVFYSSHEWKVVCSEVWKRDKATCQRCGLRKEDSEDVPFHIHHRVSFQNKGLRVSLSNLVLLCEICHLFIHSNKNINKEYIEEICGG